MSDIKWKKQYEIGHDRIDFEHHIFVDLIAKIDDAVKEDKDKRYLEGLLKELRAYTEFHFISEENIMYSVAYPDYEAHKHYHEDLLNQYSQKILAIDLGEEAIEDFLLFLKDWFVTHTLKEDMKIARFVSGKDV